MRHRPPRPLRRRGLGRSRLAGQGPGAVPPVRVPAGGGGGRAGGGSAGGGGGRPRRPGGGACVGSPPPTRPPASTLLHPADAQHFLEVCDRPGKPVPFVPVIDGEVRRWFMADALWQAQDDRYPVDSVIVIPGPRVGGRHHPGRRAGGRPAGPVRGGHDPPALVRRRRPGRVPRPPAGTGWPTPAWPGLVGGGGPGPGRAGRPPVHPGVGGRRTGRSRAQPALAAGGVRVTRSPPSVDDAGDLDPAGGAAPRVGRGGGGGGRR